MSAWTVGLISLNGIRGEEKIVLATPGWIKGNFGIDYRLSNCGPCFAVSHLPSQISFAAFLASLEEIQASCEALDRAGDWSIDVRLPQMAGDKVHYFKPVVAFETAARAAFGHISSLAIGLSGALCAVEYNDLLKPQLQ